MDAERQIQFKSVINFKIEEIKKLINCENDFFDEINIRFTESQKRRISALKEALSRLEEGSFGKCCECEEPIPEKRLMVSPESMLCIRCQEKLERKSRLKGQV